MFPPDAEKGIVPNDLLHPLVTVAAFPPPLFATWSAHVQSCGMFFTRQPLTHGDILSFPHKSFAFVTGRP